jgi:hypothetical protein
MAPRRRAAKATLKATGGTMTRHDDGDGRHDDGKGWTKETGDTLMAMNGING